MASYWCRVKFFNLMTARTLAASRERDSTIGFQDAYYVPPCGSFLKRTKQALLNQLVRCWSSDLQSILWGVLFPVALFPNKDPLYVKAVCLRSFKPSRKKFRVAAISSVESSTSLLSQDLVGYYYANNFPIYLALTSQHTIVEPSQHLQAKGFRQRRPFFISSHPTTAAMCWNVITLDYLCGHKREPSHGIPDQFIRECDRMHNTLFDRSRTVHSRFLQENIPWLCPDCHWSITSQGLGPLYASAIQTGQSTIHSLAQTLIEGQSSGVLAISNQLRRAIQQTQESILSSGDIFHNLAAQALRDFLGAAAFRSLQDDTRNINHPWGVIPTENPRNPFQRLTLPEESSGIRPGWTLGPDPQARVDPPPRYSGEPNNASSQAPEPMPSTCPPTSAPPTMTHSNSPPDYDLLHPWTSTDLDRVRAPHPVRGRVVAEGDSSDSSLDEDSPATIMARELRRKQRALLETQNMPQPNSRRNLEWGRDLRSDIAELELLAQEERSFEDLRGQLEPLTRAYNSMRRLGVRRDEESRSLLQERIESLYQQLDTINVYRATRGVPVTWHFPLHGSTRELILIRDQDNSGLSDYDDSYMSQAEDGSEDGDQGESANGSHDDSEDGDAPNPENNTQDDSEDNSEDNSEDSSAGSNGSFMSDGSYREYLIESEQNRLRLAQLSADQAQLQAQLEFVQAGLQSLYTGAQNNSYAPRRFIPPPQQLYPPRRLYPPPNLFSPQQEPLPTDDDVVMGEATTDADESDLIE